MIEIQLKQGSQEWLDYRSIRIGASDAPPILGISPYKTRMELWNEKLGLSKGQTKSYAMQRGNDLEPIIREEMSYNLDCDFIPKVFISDKYPWMSASLDGIDIEKGIVIEIKCSNKQDHESAKKTIVPKKYYPQLQHILEVCGLHEIYYCSYHQDDYVYFIVKRDQDFIDDMIKQEKEFWDCLQNFNKPEINEIHKEFIKDPKNYIEIQDESWKELASQWILNQQKKKEILEEESNLRSAIISMSGDQNVKGNGLKVTKLSRKGQIDYANVMELQGIDLEIYRKENSFYWSIDQIIDQN